MNPLNEISTLIDTPINPIYIDFLEWSLIFFVINVVHLFSTGDRATYDLGWFLYICWGLLYVAKGLLSGVG